MASQIKGKSLTLIDGPWSGYAFPSSGSEDQGAIEKMGPLNKMRPTTMYQRLQCGEQPGKSEDLSSIYRCAPRGVQYRTFIASKQ
jgi:hypothetical protein